MRRFGVHTLNHILRDLRLVTVTCGTMSDVHVQYVRLLASLKYECIIGYLYIYISIGEQSPGSPCCNN